MPLRISDTCMHRSGLHRLAVDPLRPLKHQDSILLPAGRWPPLREIFLPGVYSLAYVVPKHRTRIVSIAISLFFTVHMLACFSLSHGLAFPLRISTPAKSFSPQQFGISLSPREKTGNPRIDTLFPAVYDALYSYLSDSRTARNAYAQADSVRAELSAHTLKRMETKSVYNRDVCMRLCVENQVKKRGIVKMHEVRLALILMAWFSCQILSTTVIVPRAFSQTPCQGNGIGRWEATFDWTFSNCSGAGHYLTRHTYAGGRQRTA
jgi:hypothetical protein